MSHPFHRNRMRWLNAVFYDCSMSPMSCRIAFLIADHLNSVSGDAWPSIDRIADRLCVSTKTVQRSVKELEQAGWLSVNRSKGRMRSNRYRPNLMNEETRQARDKFGRKTGRHSPKKEDSDVPQSYLRKLPKTFSQEAFARKERRFPDQGTYEERIIQRYGPHMRGHLEALAIRDPAALARLCREEKHGVLTESDLHHTIMSLPVSNKSISQ
jgi:hypothetical protein